MTAAKKKPAPAKKLTLEQAQALAIQTKQAAKAAALDLARLQHLEAKARQEAERAADTRRKILLGAYLMAQAKAQGWEISTLHIGQQTLADYLTRDEDRALFSLPPIPVLTTQVQAPEAQGAGEPPAGQP